VLANSDWRIVARTRSIPAAAQPFPGFLEDKIKRIQERFINKLKTYYTSMKRPLCDNVQRDIILLQCFTYAQNRPESRENHDCRVLFIERET
jgi:hypothetical protein